MGKPFWPIDGGIPSDSRLTPIMAVISWNQVLFYP